MDTPERVSRNYRMPVSDMLLRASAMHGFYLVDQPAFEAVNPKFTVLWGTEFGTAITAALNAAPPDFHIADQKLETAELHTAISNVRQQLQKLFYYVREKWPNSREKQEHFGTALYRKYYNSQGNMLQLAKSAYNRANEAAADLLTVGYEATDLTALLTSVNVLEAEKDDQMNIMGTNKEATAAYYTLANTVYGYMVELAEARGLAFPDDYAKWSHYVIDPEGTSDGRIQKTLNVPMMDFIQYEFPEPIDQATTVIRLENKGVNDLGFAFLPIQHEGPPPATFPIVAGETLERTQSDWAMMGQWIYVDNQFSDPGILEVSFVPAEV